MAVIKGHSTEARVEEIRREQEELKIVWSKFDLNSDPDGLVYLYIAHRDLS